MIIQCINCNKKFEVSSTLIPFKGRDIQCGSCNHTWFYKPNTEIVPENLTETNKEDKNSNNVQETVKDEIIINDNSFKTAEITKKAKIKKTSGFNLGKILSYLLVGIITFIALIIILDTFESTLSSKLPSLELILYNLFETIEDIILFLKDLFL